MPIVAEAAARLGKVLTRKTATESPATAEMAPAKAAAHVSAAEPAHVSAAAETPTVSTPTSPAARKRVSGQSPGESGSRSQDDHGLT
jgi:hypothetical protein